MSASNGDLTAAPEPARRTDSPPGMRRLIVFQFWDNLAFSGSRLLFVLYLLDVLAHPGVATGIWGMSAVQGSATTWFGLRSDQAFVSACVGLFGAMANITPAIGGWLSDRLISRRNAVITGGLLMAAGHAMLAMQGPFLLGLVALACGNGLYRGTTSALLANLFKPGDPRLSAAFQLSYFGGNLSGMAAPLLCGTLGEFVGWSWGFGAAGVAMLVGLTTFLAIPPGLLADRANAPQVAAERRTTSSGARLLVLGAVALFLVGNEQLGNAIVVWLKTAVDRHLGAMTVPVTWFFSVAPLTVAAATILLARWRPIESVAGLRRRMMCGVIIGGCAWGLLAVAATAHHVAATTLILFLVLWGSAFALVLPSGAGLIAELAPETARGRWLGVYLLMTMIADLTVGALGGLYERMPHPAFIGLHAAFVLAAAAPLLLLAWRDRAAARP